jgi:hypothetical protein
MTFSLLVWTFERRRLHTDGVALPYLFLSNISKIEVYAHIWLCSFLLKIRLRLLYDLSRSLFSKLSTLGEVWIETFAPELKKTKPSSYGSVLPHLLLKFINFSKIYAILTI